METDELKQAAIMTIDLGLTRQPAPYQSVRVSVSLPVIVEAGDDAQDLLRAHVEQAMVTLRQQVDDEFEVGHSAPAPYSNERRFVALVAREARKLVIIPVDKKGDVPGNWRQNTREEYEGHRLGYILGRIMRDFKGYDLVSCLEGDFDMLPPLEELVLWSYRPGEDEEKLSVLTKPGENARFSNSQWPGWWSSGTYFREYGASVLNELEARATKDKARFIDCYEGDFSKLPAPVVKVKVEAEEEEIPFEEDDDGYGDEED